MLNIEKTTPPPHTPIPSPILTPKLLSWTNPSVFGPAGINDCIQKQLRGGPMLQNSQEAPDGSILAGPKLLVSGGGQAALAGAGD